MKDYASLIKAYPVYQVLKRAMREELPNYSSLFVVYLCKYNIRDVRMLLNKTN